MEITNKFISVVCLGNFNPSILTPEFLNDTCKLGLNLKKENVKKFLPMISVIKYENIEFSVDFDRFQSIEENIADFKKTEIVSYFDKYIDVLQHTPLIVCGINFNSIIKIDDVDLLNDLLQDNKRLLELLKTKSFTINSTKTIKSDENSWIFYELVYSETENNNIRLSFRKVDNEIKFNFNYEITNIFKDKDGIKKITKNLSKLCSKNENITKIFFKE